MGYGEKVVEGSSSLTSPPLSPLHFAPFCLSFPHFLPLLPAPLCLLSHWLCLYHLLPLQPLPPCLSLTLSIWAVVIEQGCWTQTGPMHHDALLLPHTCQILYTWHLFWGLHLTRHKTWVGQPIWCGSQGGQNQYCMWHVSWALPSPLYSAWVNSDPEAALEAI